LYLIHIKPRGTYSRDAAVYTRAGHEWSCLVSCTSHLPTSKAVCTDRLPLQIDFRMGWGEVLSHQRVGPRFRKHRRIIQDQFSPQKISQYDHILRKEAYSTLTDLGNTPDGDLMTHLKRFVSVLIYTLASLTGFLFRRFSMLCSRSH
jgi:cytochrome P450